MTPAQKYRERHPDRVKASQAKYKENNSEKLKQSQKKYRERHPDRVAESQRKHKKKVLESSPKIFMEKKLLKIKKKQETCRESAKCKFELYDLTIESLMEMWEAQNGRCALTNKKMTYAFNCLFSVSIDRIDSNKGYTKDNVQLVCQGANYAKNKFTNSEFLNFWHNEEPS